MCKGLSSKGGHRETCFSVLVDAHYKFALYRTSLHCIEWHLLAVHSASRRTEFEAQKPKSPPPLSIPLPTGEGDISFPHSTADRLHIGSSLRMPPQLLSRVASPAFNLQTITITSDVVKRTGTGGADATMSCSCYSKGHTYTVLFLMTSLMLFRSSLNRFTDAINMSISTSVHFPLNATRRHQR